MKSYLVALCGFLMPLAAQAGTLTTVYDVQGVNDGATPEATLLKAGGRFYGTTFGGGATNGGTIFKADPATGKETIVHTFTGGSDGVSPAAGLISVGGILYGTTTGGGANGVGTVFKFDPETATETVIYSFTDAGEGGDPTSPLLEYKGMLYGTNTFGGDGTGYIYKIDPATGAETTVYSFNGLDDGAYPSTAVVLGGDKLYGTTAFGGENARGVLYQVDPVTGAEAVLHSFGQGDKDGQEPSAPVTVLGRMIYGTAGAGGTKGKGTLFAYDLKAGTETTLHNFTGKADGGTPSAGMLNVGGVFYGSAELGGANGLGTIFSFDPGNGTLTTVHALTEVEGGAPAAELLYADGLLYGTATDAGASNDGTLFAVDPASGDGSLLHSFSGTLSSDVSALTKVGGDLFGTSTGGGAAGLGSIFKVDAKSGKGTNLFSFTGGSLGSGPNSGLLDVGGILYGTTLGGGTVFAFDPKTRVANTVYAFGGGSDGVYPGGDLIAAGGILYGTTRLGGASGFGTIYKLDPASGVETVLYSFSGGDDGAFPVSGVVAAGGVLYGTAISGGANKDGTVFQFDLASGTETTLYSFRGSTDGADPTAGLVYADGVLYGATAGFGQKRSHGTVFKFDLATGTETVLDDFGIYSGPQSALIKIGGELYGPRLLDGFKGNGSIIKINAVTGKMKTLYRFTGGNDGGFPDASLLNIKGILYGTTQSIESSNAGTVFKLPD